ncbi:unnamed protein product [Heterotrigona itama]|uniref:Uncharacterized protein n=1 Tax=Heterotrigona itama TaxID=395501 RepID=A0A6V7GWU3_9HYME|nr:unnamed protein product [Heterotrigona itama]
MPMGESELAADPPSGGLAADYQPRLMKLMKSRPRFTSEVLSPPSLAESAKTSRCSLKSGDSRVSKIRESNSMVDVCSGNSQLLLVICALLVHVVATAETEEAQAGRSRVSDEQLNTALSDQRYLRRQLKCALGEAPCDPVGRRLKSLAPLVLRGSCPQCSPEETRQIKKVLSHIQRTYPKEWSKIVQQYAGVS